MSLAKTHYLESRELRESGVLQEANRLFFHSLGLALCLKADGTLEIEDGRDDPEGFVFVPTPEAKRLASVFENLRKVRHEARRKGLGYVKQPIEEIDAEQKS